MLTVPEHIIKQLSNSDLVFNEFANLWVRSSELTKKVILYLWNLSIKYRFVFPSHETIAKACGCTDRQVRRILKKLLELDIISWMNTAYQSNTYFLNTKIVQLNLKDSNTLKNLYKIDANVRQNVRVLENNNKTKNEINESLKSDRKAKVLSYQDLPEKYKHPFLERFDFANYGWIFKRLKEQEIEKAINDLRYMANRSKNSSNPLKIENFCRYFMSRCMKLLKNTVPPCYHMH